MTLPNPKRCCVAIMLFAMTLIIAPVALSAPATSPVDSDDKPPLKKEELEQLLAPIALYPDSLLTQMLMASTYPLEIVQADRWVKANKDLKGDALAKELEKQDWDPSVKSMVNFPEQLAAMSDKLDLTVKIGNAFLEQQADVLNTIQVLRNLAQAEGNLKSSDKQKVDVQTAPTTATANNSTVVNVDTGAGSQLTPTIVQEPPRIITIESPDPDVIYVPSYNPTYVYGGWPYPSYPPYYYYPPGYYYGSNLVSFGLGVAAGAAWGYAWGNCNWGGGDVDIDVNRNFERNTNINRDQARQNIENRQGNRQTNRDTRQGNRQTWQHDSSHRKGASYRDQRTADRFGGANSSRQAASAREQYRGRAEAGRQDLARGGADQFRGTGSVNRGGTGNVGPNRIGSSGINRTPSAANRGYSGTRGGTFSGVSGGGGGARMESSRGRSSGGYRSSPSRSGGGGSRGGGGGRGGGGRGGGRR
jgi:hypothetical protein